MKLALLKFLGVGFRTSGDTECDHMSLLIAVQPCLLLSGLALFLFVASWHIGVGSTVCVYIYDWGEGSGCAWILGTWIG